MDYFVNVATFFEACRIFGNETIRIISYVVTFRTSQVNKIEMGLFDLGDPSVSLDGFYGQDKHRMGSRTFKLFLKILKFI